MEARANPITAVAKVAIRLPATAARAPAERRAPTRPQRDLQTEPRRSDPHRLTDGSRAMALTARPAIRAKAVAVALASTISVTAAAAAAVAVAATVGPRATAGARGSRPCSS